jgi:hypothetical protein
MYGDNHPMVAARHSDGEITVFSQSRELIVDKQRIGGGFVIRLHLLLFCSA